MKFYSVKQKADIPMKREKALEYLGLAPGETGILNSRNLQF